MKKAHLRKRGRKDSGLSFGLPKAKRRKLFNDKKIEECADECIEFLRNYYVPQKESEEELNRLIKKAERIKNTQNKKSKSLDKLPSDLKDVKLESDKSDRIKLLNNSSIKEEYQLDNSRIDDDIDNILAEDQMLKDPLDEDDERDNLMAKIRNNKLALNTNLHGNNKQVISCIGPDVSSLDKFMQYKNKIAMEEKKKAESNNNKNIVRRSSTIAVSDINTVVNNEEGTPGPLQSNWDNKLFKLYTEYINIKKRRCDEIYENSLEENRSRYVAPVISSKHVSRMLVKPQKRWFGTCSMGSQCEMRTLMYETGQPFTGMIYHTPEEYDKVMKTKKKLLTRGCCYICIISATTLEWQKNNASNHKLEPIYTPFQHVHSQPGEYHRKYMIQHSMGYTDGILVPFRQFDVSQYRETLIETKLPSGKTVKLRGFEEKEELFFVNSSMDSKIPLVNPNFYSTIKVKELTTEFILREIFSIKELARDYIESIFERYRVIEFVDEAYYHSVIGFKSFDDKKKENGLLDNIFGEKPKGQTRNRGIKFEKPLPEEEESKFKGLPFNYIFTEDISVTESRIVDLADLFGYRQADDEGRLIYKYPGYRLHDLDVQYFNRELHEEAHTKYKKYHALHIRINVALCLLEILFKKNDLTYYDAVEVFDFLSNPHNDKKKNPSILQLKKTFTKIKGDGVRIFRKIDLFLKGHLKLIQLYCEKGILEDEWFEQVPKTKVRIPTETDEWRTYGELYNPRAEKYFEKEDERHVRYRVKLHEKPSPDVMIRDFYSKKNIDTSICFCDFKTTLKFIKSMSDDNIKSLWDRCNGFPHWRPDINKGYIKSLFESDNIREYIILITLLFRINKAYSSIDALLTNVKKAESRLYKLESEEEYVSEDDVEGVHKDIEYLRKQINEYKEVIYNLRLFASTHVDLSIYMCQTEQFKDSELKKTMKGLELTSAYDAYYPETNRLFHEGDLPDFSNRYSYVNFISDNWVNNGDNEWFYLAAKTMPKCCQSRKWIQKHNEACSKNDAYTNWVISCLTISLLGFYRECTKWPNFEDTLVITKFFNRMKQKENLEEFIKFQTEHGSIVMNALREYMFFVIKFNTPYLKVIKSYFTKWDEFESTTRKKMDMIRHLYNNRKEKGVTLWIINKMVDDVFFDDRKVYRRNPSKFANFMYDRFKDINAELSKKRGRKKKNTDPETTTIEEYQRRPDKLSDFLVTLVDDFVSRVDTKKDIVLNELENIGVSKKGIVLLKCCYLQFLSREQNRAIVTQLKQLTMRDYEIVYYFFHALKISTSILAIQTGYDVYLQQEEALREKYGISRYEEIPDATKAIVFSQCCQDKKTFDAQTHGVRFYGHEKVAYDKFTQKFLCCGKKSKNNSKKREKKQQNSGKGKSTRKQDKNRYNKKCKETEVVVLPILGHVVQFDNAREKPNPKSYTVCPNIKCGTITEFGLSMFGPNGFTCGKCDEEQRNKYEFPECSGKCGKIGVKMTKWSTIYMLDDCDTEDGPGTYTMKRYHFCADCSRKCIITKLNKTRGVNITNDHHTQSISYKESLALLGNAIRTDDFQKVMWSCATNVKRYVKTTNQF